MSAHQIPEVPTRIDGKLTGSGSPATREPISGFVVCLNEEEQISACLDTLHFCDELIVVDSFSTDRTVEICHERGVKVIQRPWPGYREQKEFALSAVSHEWVINLDADERVSPDLHREIEQALTKAHLERLNEKDSSLVGYEVNRVVFHLGQWWRRGGWYPEWRLRFFRKSAVSWGGVEPHEKVIPHGRTERLNGELLHYTYRSLSDQFERLHRYSCLAAVEEWKAKGKKPGLWSLVGRPVARFFRFYIIKKGYREGTPGLIVAIAEAYYAFMKYAKVWELALRDESEKKQKIF